MEEVQGLQVIKLLIIGKMVTYLQLLLMMQAC